MNSPTIALFANHGSPQLMAVRDALVEEGAAPVVFDIQLGGGRKPSVFMAPGEARWDGVDFGAIQAVHIRCTAPNTLPAVPPRMNAASYAEWRSPYLREQEYQATTFSFFNHLIHMGKLVVNPLTVGYIDHDSKGQLYMRLRAAGFPVPETLTTNDPNRAEAFLQQCGELVVKPAIGVGSTRLLTHEDLGFLDEIALCPVLLQQRIKGHTLRV
ncbi:MAG: hypothetical protein HQL55_14925, partial [Magnetococcales bacterium]|nr:hypothetical protein [Magnetococcales bacterium]